MAYREITRYVDKQLISDQDQIIDEMSIALYVNREYLAQLIITPADLTELVYGYLYCEKIISQPEEFSEISIDTTLRQLHVTILPQNITSPHGFQSQIAAKFEQRIDHISEYRSDEFPIITSHICHSAQEIIDSIRLLNQASDLFKKTGGVHSVGLWFEERFQWICDDIGRHHAFNKVIGYALRRHWPLPEEAMIVSTSRISTDLVLKTLRARIPMLISKSAPTDTAIQLAKLHGITLIGFVRDERFNIYTHPQRIRIT